MKTFYLREIAHARAGDKGDTCNIGVIAYRPAYYPVILEQVTVERVASHFRALVHGPVTRYELPNVDAINLVLERALGGGVTRSLSLDPHGKSYSALLLTLPVTVDDAIAERLQRQGRVPLADDTRHGPAADRVHLTVGQARQLALQALAAIGYDASESAILADHLLDAALCGYEYSGLPKILQIAANPKARNPRAPVRAIHETEVSVLFDGGNHSGMLAMHHATQAAIAKAQQRGLALVGVTNSWMSGRSAHYVEKIARADLIGIHTVGSASLVAPPGGARPALGTNPIAFGFPTTGDPLVIDLSTAAFPGTELDFHVLLGLPLPEGVAIDGDGRPTRDPALAKTGALLPFGGHKGFALALAMQALGILAGSGFNAAKDYGYLLIAIRPDLLVALDEFKRELTATLERIRSTPRQPGVDQIRLPSERAFSERHRRLREGIEIDRAIHAALLALAQRHHPG